LAFSLNAGAIEYLYSPTDATDWENAKYQKVPQLGTNEISMRYEKSGDELSLEVSQTEKKWGISIEILRLIPK